MQSWPSKRSGSCGRVPPSAGPVPSKISRLCDPLCIPSCDPKLSIKVIHPSLAQLAAMCHPQWSSIQRSSSSEIEILLAFLTLLHLFNPSFPKTTVFGIAGRMATRQQPTSYGTVVKEKQTISSHNSIR